MTKINTAILVSILAISCFRNVRDKEIVPVNLPAKPCEIPPEPPPPEFSAPPWDCDGPGPETSVCFHEADFIKVVVWLKQWMAWAEVVKTCESLKVTMEWGMKAPPAVETPVMVNRI